MRSSRAYRLRTQFLPLSWLRLLPCPPAAPVLDSCAVCDLPALVSAFPRLPWSVVSATYLAGRRSHAVTSNRPQRALSPVCCGMPPSRPPTTLFRVSLDRVNGPGPALLHQGAGLPIPHRHLANHHTITSIRLSHYTTGVFIYYNRDFNLMFIYLFIYFIFYYDITRIYLFVYYLF